jgi:hypothetical protein
LSFIATLVPIASVSVNKSSAMPCCVGKAVGHCDSGIPAAKVPEPEPEPMCGLKTAVSEDDGITIVAEPAHTESHHSPNSLLSQTAEFGQLVTLFCCVLALPVGALFRLYWFNLEGAVGFRLTFEQQRCKLGRHFFARFKFERGRELAAVDTQKPTQLHRWVGLKALPAAPDQRTWFGRRDHAFLLVAVQTGLRLSEMTGLKRDDVIIGTGAHVRVIGKGRKERCTPLAKSTIAVLKTWLREPQRGHEGVLFPNARGGRLSADAVALPLS